MAAVVVLHRLCWEYRFVTKPKSSVGCVRAMSTTVDKVNGVNYRIRVFEVRQSTRFATWLAGLRDERARARILKRIDRVQTGSLGDVGAVGERD